MAPAFTELDRMGQSRSNRWGSRITNFLLHTQEGDGTAESLAAYLNNSNNNASYHYTVRDGVVCDVVDTDYASWSVLDANPYTINLCFAGSRASWSRSQWLQIEDDIAVAAWVAVQDAHRYGFSTEVIAPPYYRADGLSDHKYVTQELGIGTHTDVGYNFPWDVFAGYVAQFDGSVPAVAPVNEINAKADVSPWLGARKTAGENVTPDGVGRWVEFEAGYIYWSSATGAHPIPTSIFEKWAELRWETSILGYPVTDHTVLKDGDVQGFERGAIYRKYGQPGFEVHGEIRNRWNRTGFETGPFGWPTSDEYGFDGGAAQNFENGRIYWPGKRNTLALLTADGPDTPVAD